MRHGMTNSKALKFHRYICTLPHFEICPPKSSKSLYGPVSGLRLYIDLSIDMRIQALIRLSLTIHRCGGSVRI
jgi:hypothetical protein